MKSFKIGYRDPESNRKDKSMMMYRNEMGALVRATEASIPGVARLVACTDYNGFPGLVLGFHGE